ncbi:type II toxin-antitoxin system CcdA family antitoxin [Hyphomicrobium sp. CS1GBMeth3]|uniref:type II toxin-antitoxin system CcdA family antitoxin n=1 Tax=Hyphomicrobium sp. CS1GBMeth3 TaxID=1892845 RepID=UPI0009314BAC|nr:type II toxin-antitoxin system CcdA family antitoxin [Hyphomicrobium sp. CS1GBMeth3]
MDSKAPKRKRAVNLSIDAELVREAKAAGANMSALLEAALRDLLETQRTERWREENREALAAYDRHIEKDGLWFDEFRTW